MPMEFVQFNLLVPDYISCFCSSWKWFRHRSWDL